MNMCEVYTDTGEHSIKFIIGKSEKIEVVDVRMTNADGLPIKFSFKRWGTKLNVTFNIDDSIPDGVLVIDVIMRNCGLDEIRERFCCWVVK